MGNESLLIRTQLEEDLSFPFKPLSVFVITFFAFLTASSTIIETRNEWTKIIKHSAIFFEYPFLTMAKKKTVEISVSIYSAETILVQFNSIQFIFPLETCNNDNGFRHEWEQ